MTNPERIMIIAWKWRQLMENIVDLKTWQQNENRDIGWWKGKYFDEFSVVEPKRNNDEEYIPVVLGGKVVRLRTEEHKGFEVLPFIYKLINDYKSQHTEVLVFLHRNDGFSADQVQDILRDTPADKCFLFSEGEDFIYYKTQGVGLLGEHGDFFYQPPRGEQVEERVANDKHQVVFKRYFDKTWQYYEHEFQTKILELRDDFLDYLFGNIPAGNEKWENGSWEGLLRGNKSLSLRIGSFVNEISGREVEALKQLEKSRQKSYVFDDSQKNIEHFQHIKEEYEALVQSIKKGFYQEGPIPSTPPRTYLLKLQDQFQQLLDSLHSN